MSDKNLKEELIPGPEPVDVCETGTPNEHVLMFKTLENPLRRKIIKEIGVFGKTKSELKKELNLSDFQLKFQLDFLIHGCYVEMDGDTCKLTERGVDLLSNI
ncbi:MAG: hypothetical protein ACE5KE_06915 [Methanosarcinales archaeon]